MSSDSSEEEIEGWVCNLCRVRNKEKDVVCKRCRTVQASLRPQKATMWFCPTCEMPNPPELDICEMCASPNPCPLPKEEEIHKSQTWTQKPQRRQKRVKIDKIALARKERQETKRDILRKANECLWEEKVNKYGNTYYYNKITERKTLSQPKELRNESVCHACDVGLATFKCGECKQRFCTQCDEITHNDTTHPEKYDHKRDPLRFEWWLDGERVVLQGMKRKIELNGMLATIIKVRDNGKFDIRLDIGKVRTNMSSKFFKRPTEEQLQWEKKERQRKKAKEAEEKALEDKIREEEEMKKTEEEKKKSKEQRMKELEEKKEKQVTTFLDKHHLTKKDKSWNLNQVGITDKDCESIHRVLLPKKEGNYILGEQVRVRDEGEKWQLGVVTENIDDDPEVALEGCPAATWDEVERINTELKMMDLSRNDISDDGIIEIAEALKQNTTLTELRMWEIKIESDGAVKLGEALNVNNVLTSLDMRQNPDIGKEASQALATAIIKNETMLDFGGIPVQEMAENSKLLEKINIHRTGCCITEALVLGLLLKTNSTLTKLNISSNNIGDFGLEAITEGLKQNSRLMDLMVANNKITDVGVQSITSALAVNRHLTSLDLRDNWDITVNGAKEIFLALQKTNTLQVFSRCSVFYLKNARKDELHLTQLDIGDTEAMVIAEFLRVQPNITHLYLNANKICDKGVHAIGKYLKKENCTLKILQMEDNKISVGGGQSIGRALTKNTSLTILDMSNNPIQDNGAEVIGNGLEKNHTLTKLTLNRCNYGDDGAEAIGFALKNNSGITEIHCGYNNITDSGCQAFGTALYFNTTLTELWLKNNRIGDVGGDTMFHGIGQNSTLITLHLEVNQIGDGIAPYLARELKKNSTLINLHMQQNGLSHNGKGDMSCGCIGHRSIRNLQLEWKNDEQSEEPGNYRDCNNR